MAKKKGAVTNEDPVEERIIIRKDSSFMDYVSYQPGNWSVGMAVEFVATNIIDPLTRLPIATDVTAL